MNFFPINRCDPELAAPANRRALTTDDLTQMVDDAANYAGQAAASEANAGDAAERAEAAAERTNDAEGYAASASASASAASDSEDAAQAAAASVAKGQPNGTAPLDSGAKLPEANVPTRLTEQTLNGTFAAIPNIARAGIGIRATLERAQRSVGIQVAGCSTSDGPTDWPRLLAGKLAAAYPAYTVQFWQWSDANQNYSAPEIVSTGTGGELYMDLLPGGLAFEAPTTPLTGDLDIRVKMRPASWAPNAGGDRDIVGQYEQTANRRNFLFSLLQDGKLRLTYSVDGANSVFINSTAGVAFTGSTDGWIRVVHDVDNGASGNTVTFYTSTDGVSWTQVGSPVVTAGAVTRYAAPSTDSYTLGCREATNPSRAFTGRIYQVRVLSGISGFDVVPSMPDLWRNVTLFNQVLSVGAPILSIYNASVAGQSSRYHNLSTRRPKEFAALGQRLFLMDTGHNESQTTWRSDVLSFLGNIKAEMPTSPIVVISPNACLIGSTATPSQQEVYFRADIGAGLQAVAQTVGGYGIDLWPILKNPAAETTDGLHPNVAGQQKWADYVGFQLLGLVATSA